jgi:hypothetical protein
MSVMRMFVDVDAASWTHPESTQDELLGLTETPVALTGYTDPLLLVRWSCP